MAGALYLKEQREAFGGDSGAGLRAYNSGPGNVNVNDLTDISKTGTGDPTYVGKVLNFADIISICPCTRYRDFFLRVMQVTCLCRWR